VAAVVMILVTVVGVGLFGGSGREATRTAPEAGAADEALGLSGTVESTIAAALRQIEAARPKRLGPPPWAYNGRAVVPLPRSTRLHVLGWQVDPYQT
jgi:hypothetical protein